MNSNHGFMAVRHWVIRGNHFDNANEKLVYLVLCDHTDDNSTCFPSVDTIAKESLLCRSTVFKCLSTLESKGLIRRIARKANDGGRQSNMYYIETAENRIQGNGSAEDKTLYQAPESTPTVEPTHEPTPAEPARDLAPVQPATYKRQEYPTEFEQLWTLYPKHVAKMAAYKAWRKAKVGMNSAFLMAKVQAFAAQCANTETRFIPNFATWLNGERWNDEYRPDPPQARKPATNAERNLQNLTQAMEQQTDLFGFQIESGVSRA